MQYTVGCWNKRCRWPAVGAFVWRSVGRGAFLGMLVLLVAACSTSQAAESVQMTPMIADRPVPPASHFPDATDVPVVSTTPTKIPTPIASPTPARLTGAVTVGLAEDLPEEFLTPLMDALTRMEVVQAANGSFPVRVLDEAANATTRIQLASLAQTQYPLAERVYAVVVPFHTLTDDITLEELQLRWQGLAEGPIFVAPSVGDSMAALLGERVNEEGSEIDGATSEVAPAQLLASLEENPSAVGIVPFDELDPSFKVLTVDGINILDSHTDLSTYPLIAAVSIKGQGAGLLAHELRAVIDPQSNRNTDALTSLMMTGVTAMSRGTAAQMEAKGYTYPAEIISDTLSAADITHISNEVPFLDDCEVNNTLNNLVLCSDTTYWAALEAVGTDIVGLSGNHVNDFGRDGAERSLNWYRENEIPIYGSGMNIEEACAPLYWEHNGNTFAFVAALAFDPPSAWATEDLPGACYYYDNQEMILELVESLADEVDIVSVELQYLEVYSPYPTDQQVREFRELRGAGADIVTGVQSHVPQALETYGRGDAGGPGVIVYGLGNLFFDQMWSWETRTELYVRHTIYEGKVIQTEILTGVLEDFARPRWATPVERNDILTRIFAATPVRY